MPLRLCRNKVAVVAAPAVLVLPRGALEVQEVQEAVESILSKVKEAEVARNREALVAQAAAAEELPSSSSNNNSDHHNNSNHKLP